MEHTGSERECGHKFVLAATCDVCADSVAPKITRAELIAEARAMDHETLVQLYVAAISQLSNAAGVDAAAVSGGS